MKQKIIESLRLASMLFTPLFLICGIIGIIIIAILTTLSPKVEATVIAHESYTSDEGDEYFKPIYSYDFEGKNYTETSMFGSNPKALSVGEKVKIFLIMNDPKRAGLYGFRYNYLPFIAIIIMGLLSLITYKLTTENNLTKRSTE